ncbi:hypothetical protein HN283_06100 [Acinetobacter baumannii]|uniref:hypothetical protein n=1 Tax=Acinetobacter baumannii TaxID=470 RepID=UPI00044CB369|nr:hypothetical protein [Acinetobacter baumannii]EKX8606297.1 hypothetical protein [Acinetobacter baumannii]EXB21789.1 hypothetical protein J535_0302 [Acinetobacter baumannii 1429530]EXB33542.1 hypothetical protein J518_1235 [Acinetobacter baumannii 1419130]KAF0617885.1 hypothetical protein AB71192_03283 [Acinetobacter baumannii]MBF6680699.1 hypothetical protein [Acinetobacter baumannii]
MKLFFEDLILYGGIRQVELSNIHKHEEIIDELAPESIMAETTSENEIVLIQAEQNWSCFGLFYPKLSMIPKLELVKNMPKIFLLDKRDSAISEFNEIGKVVFDYIEYEREVAKLVFCGAYIYDEDE